MRDVLVDLKRPSKRRDKSLTRATFSSVFGNQHFSSKQIVITQTNFILPRRTHYSSKPGSMNEIDFSRFPMDFEGCLIVTDIHS